MAITGRLRFVSFLFADHPLNFDSSSHEPVSGRPLLIPLSVSTCVVRLIRYVGLGSPGTFCQGERGKIRRPVGGIGGAFGDRASQSKAPPCRSSISAHPRTTAD